MASDADLQAALDNFDRAIAQALLLTDGQQTALTNAAEQFFEDLPVGVLDPTLVASLQSALEAKGLPVAHLADTKVGDLGALGGHVAESLAMKLEDAAPAAFYSVGAALAAAIGYAAWAGGSERLEKLGIKPELQKGFFNDRLDASLGLAWDPHFTNVSAQGTLDARVHDWKLSAGATVAKSGLQSAKASVTYRPNDDLSLSAAVTAQLHPTPSAQADLEADWKIRDGLNFSLSGTYDPTGEKRVGAGLTWTF